MPKNCVKKSSSSSKKDAPQKKKAAKKKGTVTEPLGVFKDSFELFLKMEKLSRESQQLHTMICSGNRHDNVEVVESFVKDMKEKLEGAREDAHRSWHEFKRIVDSNIPLFMGNLQELEEEGKRLEKKAQEISRRSELMHDMATKVRKWEFSRQGDSPPFYL